jgi:hypothetical protein
MKIEHSSVEAKENEVLKLRRSSRSLIRKVRFEGKKCWMYEGVSKSSQTGCLEQELQTVQLSATRHSCIIIL